MCYNQSMKKKIILGIIFLAVLGVIEYQLYVVALKATYAVNGVNQIAEFINKVTAQNSTK